MSSLQELSDNYVNRLFNLQVEGDITADMLYNIHYTLNPVDLIAGSLRNVDGKKARVLINELMRLKARFGLGVDAWYGLMSTLAESLLLGDSTDVATYYDDKIITLYHDSLSPRFLVENPLLVAYLLIYIADSLPEPR